jgi:hypothetical protein
MDALILSGIGAAALGYVIYVAWRNISGKAACNCGGSCREAAGGCHCGSQCEDK